MMVLAIITAVLGIGGIRLVDKTGGYRGQVRNMATLVRSVRNNARLNGTTCRLKFNMDDEKGHSYDVQCAPGTAVLKTEDQERALERLSNIQRGEKKSAFAPEPRILKNPVALPRGLFFGSVEVAGRTKAVQTGVAFVHFFPSGLVEESAIHVTDRKTLNWTIALSPLTGRPDVFERDVSLKELRSSP